MTSTHERSLRVGMIGYAFMGVAHSQAWRNAPSFFELPLRPELTAICGRDGAAAQKVADRFGWQSVETDWRALLERDDVDLIDICTPGNTHAEIAIAALRAGKHVLCEKPSANTVAEAEAMSDAAEAAAERGVRSMVGFTYRRVPAISLSQRLVQQGRIGTVRNVRATVPAGLDRRPRGPAFWRLRREVAGSGALGDIGAHIIDLVQHITGETSDGCQCLDRNLRQGASAPDQRTWALWFSRDRDGGSHRRRRGGLHLPAQWRRACDLRSHPVRNGTKERDPHRDQRIRGKHRVRLRGHERAVLLRQQRRRRKPPDSAGSSSLNRCIRTWAPGGPPGHLIGYEHGFTHQVVDLVGDIAAGRSPSPRFADGLKVQRILQSVESSAADGGAWVEIRDGVTV